jgi:hypothetical protein
MWAMIQSTGLLSPVWCDDDNALMHWKAFPTKHIITSSMPAKVLSLSLTNLRLRSCNSRTFAFLNLVNRMPTEKLNLKKIDLHFNTARRSAIFQCYKADDGCLN